MFAEALDAKWALAQGPVLSKPQPWMLWVFEYRPRIQKYYDSDYVAFILLLISLTFNYYCYCGSCHAEGNLSPSQPSAEVPHFLLLAAH